MKPTISFIIIEYHDLEDIQRCVQSVNEYMSAIDYEIIVSSNSLYTPEQQAAIPPMGKHVRWVCNEKNGGFAYAMNMGLKVAQGDFLTIMNPDCLLTADLMPMVQFMQRHPDVGAIAPQLVDHDGVIQDSARNYVSVPRILKRQVERIILRSDLRYEQGMNYNLVQTKDWVIGAFIMVSRAAYEQTAGLDETYFMYAEDLDWCTRIRRQGFEIVYYPRIKVIYKGTRRARHNMHYAGIFLRSHLSYWRKFGFIWGYPKRIVRFYD